jgi:hypothetical protein
MTLRASAPADAAHNKTGGQNVRRPCSPLCWPSLQENDQQNDDQDQDQQSSTDVHP